MIANFHKTSFITFLRQKPKAIGRGYLFLLAMVELELKRSREPHQRIDRMHRKSKQSKPACRLHRRGLFGRSAIVASYGSLFNIVQF
jgi:hypothetical protein